MPQLLEKYVYMLGRRLGRKNSAGRSTNRNRRDDHPKDTCVENFR